MKTFVMMIATGTFYVVIGNAVSHLVSNHPMNGDANFTYFVIGLGVGVFNSKLLGFID